MIKILLKHYIYELCIEAIFRPLIKNFKFPPRIITNDKIIYIGDDVKCITVYHKNKFRSGIIYYDCKIVDIDVKGKSFTFVNKTHGSVKIDCPPDIRIMFE